MRGTRRGGGVEGNVEGERVAESSLEFGGAHLSVRLERCVARCVGHSETGVNDAWVARDGEEPALQTIEGDGAWKAACALEHRRAPRCLGDRRMFEIVFCGVLLAVLRGLFFRPLLVVLLRRIFHTDWWMAKA